MSGVDCAVLADYIERTRRRFGAWAVVDGCVGLAMTAVVVKENADSSRLWCGLAATPHLALTEEECCRVDGPSRPREPDREGKPSQKRVFFSGQSVETCLEAIDPGRSLHRVIALAMCNACHHSRYGMPTPDAGIDRMKTVDRFGTLPLRGRTVAMVGFFAPMLEHIVEEARSVGILELDDTLKQRAFSLGYGIPDAAALRDFETILVTATTLSNGTFDALYPFMTHADVVVLGPSTPLVPDLFRSRYGAVRFLSGRIVTDIGMALCVVKQAGGTGPLRPFTEKMEFDLRLESGEV
jgi:uncharacterized protein (DUF4213/DUF364 family)